LLVSRRIFLISFPWISFGKSLIAASGMYLILTFVLPSHVTNLGSLLGYILLGAIGYLAILALLRERALLRILVYFKKAFQKQFGTV